MIARSLDSGWLSLARLVGGRRITRLAVLSVATAATEGLGLLLLVPILDIVTAGSETAGSLGSALAVLGLPRNLPTLLGLFVALVVVRSVLNLWRSLAAIDVEIGITDGLRSRAWAGLLHCNWRTLSQMRQSDSASLLITSVEQVSNGVNQLIFAMTTTITLGAIGVAALAISPLVTIIALVGGMIVLIAYRGLRRRAGELGEAFNSAHATIHAEIAEGLLGLRVIKTLGLEALFDRRLRGHFDKLRSVQRSFVLDMGLGQILLQGCGAALLAMIVWVALEVWNAPLASVVPMVVLFARALPLLGGLQDAWQNAAHARPALTSTMQLIAAVEAGAEPDTPAGIAVPQARDAIVVREVTVTFAVRNAPALDMVSLELPVGSITTLAGPSGAGKSTLADVVGGLIAPDRGAMWIDGVRLDDDLRRAWRRQVSYVQQEPVLFSGTVRDNLSLAAPDADDDRLWQALADASAEFVRNLPDGLDSPVGEAGRHLSGGERQRLALARALLRRPRLLILDEPASALDRANEAAISEAVAALRGQITILIIGHRGALADIADRTIELSGGRLVEPSMASTGG